MFTAYSYILELAVYDYHASKKVMCLRFKMCKGLIMRTRDGSWWRLFLIFGLAAELGDQGILPWLK